VTVSRQAVAKISDPVEPLRRLLGRERRTTAAEPYAGAEARGQSVVQFRRSDVQVIVATIRTTRVFYIRDVRVQGTVVPERRHHFRPETDRQKLVRGGAQRHGRTVPFQLCRGAHHTTAAVVRKFLFPVRRAHAIRTHGSVTTALLRFRFFSVFFSAGDPVRRHPNNAPQALRGPGEGQIQFHGADQHGTVVGQR